MRSSSFGDPGTLIYARSSSFRTTLLHGAVIFCCAVQGLGAEVSEGKMATDKIGEALAYPARVSIPDVVPSVACDPEDGTVILPPALYLTGHYDGWQQFLREYGEKGREALSLKWRPPGIKVSQPFLFQGMEAGHNECRDKIKSASRKYSEEELRRRAKVIYAPITTPKIPALPPP